MQIDMPTAMCIRERTHVVEIEDRYWLDYDRDDVLTALGESYLYMMAYEFPGFKILGRHMQSTVYKDVDHNVMKFAIWWAPHGGECYFPELGFGRTFEWANQKGPRLRLKMAKPPGRLSAFPNPTETVNDALEVLHDNYEPVGWSDTVHAWVYKKET